MLITILGSVLIFMLLVVIVVREEKTKARMSYYFVPAFLFGIELSYILAELFVYFGLPGTHTSRFMGGFLPTACEESLPLLGESSWPCQVERKGVFATCAPWELVFLFPVVVLTLVCPNVCRRNAKRVAKEKAEREAKEERRQLAEAIGEEVLSMREEAALTGDRAEMEKIA